MKLHHLNACVFIFLACATVSPNTTTFAKKGGTIDASIIISEKAAAADTIAANDFVKYCRLMTGVTLPINDAGKSVHIILGIPDSNTTLRNAWPDSKAALTALGSDEAFILKAVGNNLIICSPRLRGVLYGTYDFLERMGCRFFTQYDVGEVVPEKDSLVFEDNLDIREKPSTLWRGNGMADWAAKNKLNIVWSASEELQKQFCTDEIQLKNARDRDLEVLFPYYHDGLWTYNYRTAALYGCHPELFDATPYYDNKWTKNGLACFSEPGLLAQGINITKAVLRRFPEVTLFEFGTGEGSAMGCQCSLCVAQGRGYHAFINFFQNLGQEVRKEFPRMKFLLTPYGKGPYDELTPDMVPSLRRPSWLIVHQPDWGITPEITAAWQQAFQDSNYLRFSYVGNTGAILPNYNLNSFKQEVEYFRNGATLGWDGFTMNLAIPPHAADARTNLYYLHAYQIYLAGKTMWNTARTDTAWMFNDFIHGYYGGAASPAFTFYDAFVQNGGAPKWETAARPVILEMRSSAATVHEKQRVDHLYLAYLAKSACDLRGRVGISLRDSANTRADSVVVANRWHPELHAKCMEAFGSFKAFCQVNDSLMGNDRRSGEWYLPDYMKRYASTPFWWDSLLESIISSAAIEAQKEAVGELSLTAQPNPFNPAVNIAYALPAGVSGIYRLYNPAGQCILSVTLAVQARGGKGSIVWTGTDRVGDPVGSGVYVGQLTTSKGNVITQKLLMLK